DRYKRGVRLRWGGLSVPTSPAPYADTLRTMCRGRPHYAPTAPHYARTRSASCPDALRTVCRSAPHCVPGITAYFASLILFSSKKRYDRN
ncbi:MAG: hypothetical protein K2I86_01010, partial [Prevotella sp.]|nr:hypothetical protein [Prevotella sp.]